MKFELEYMQPALGRAYAIILMLVGSSVISFSGLVIRGIQEADTWQINFYRSLAFAISIIIFLILKRRKTAFKRVKFFNVQIIFAASLLALAGITFLQAITNTTVAATTFTLSSIPFLTAVMARLFLGEQIRKSTTLTIGFGALGVSLMFFQGLGSSAYFGNIMAFLCALAFSAYAIVVRRNRGQNMFPALILSNLIIIIIVLLIRKGDLFIPWEDLILCFILGGILSALVNTLFVIAAKYLLAAELTLFMLLEFTLGPIWVWLFVNEIPSGWTIVGGTIVLLAVFFKSAIELRILSIFRFE